MGSGAAPGVSRGLRRSPDEPKRPQPIADRHDPGEGCNKKYDSTLVVPSGAEKFPCDAKRRRPKNAVRSIPRMRNPPANTHAQ